MPPEIKNQKLKSVLKKIKDITPKSRYLWAVSTFATGRSAYHELGWFKSAWRAQSVDGNGNPIPWITYSAVNFLETKQKELSKMEVWEYGSGNSTLWWADKAKSIVAVEHHEGWFNFVKTTLKTHKNADVIFRNLDSGYVEEISRTKKKYDCVVIDGRKRVECSYEAPGQLKEGGIIIWDNTDRDRYQKGISKLLKQGFKRIDFIGVVPIGNYVAQTSIFYKDKNVLNI